MELSKNFLVNLFREILGVDVPDVRVGVPDIIVEIAHTNLFLQIDMFCNANIRLEGDNPLLGDILWYLFEKEDVPREAGLRAFVGVGPKIVKAWKKAEEIYNSILEALVEGELDIRSLIVLREMSK